MVLTNRNRLVFGQRLQSSEGCAGHANQLWIGDGRLTAAARGLEKSRPGSAVAFILTQAGLEHLFAAILDHFQAAEIIQDGDAPAAEDLNPFFGEALISVGQVGDAAQRAIREGQVSMTLSWR